MTLALGLSVRACFIGSMNTEGQNLEIHSEKAPILDAQVYGRSDDQMPCSKMEGLTDLEVWEVEEAKIKEALALLNGDTSSSAPLGMANKFLQ